MISVYGKTLVRNFKQIVPDTCGIWGLTEGIMILIGSITCDARGVPLRD